MIINEIFYSIQGEGLLAGVPSVFIRFAGCPLRCTWCDTKYALDTEAGEELSTPAIIDKIKKWQCKHVVITGGEPMINPQLPQLAGELKKLNKHITIETAGIKFTPEIRCDLMSISPKILSNIESVKQLIGGYKYQLKFVVDTPQDIAEIQKFIAGDELLAKAPMVAELCKQTGYTFCNRLQVLLYNGQRGK